MAFWTHAGNAKSYRKNPYPLNFLNPLRGFGNKKRRLTGAFLSKFLTYGTAWMQQR